jgi:hypothetical protein
MPDTAGVANPNGYRLSNRYWTIDGDFPDGFAGYATVFYDGRGMADQLDTELFDQTGSNEDSVLLLYRPAPGFPWTEHPKYQKNKLSSSVDRYGTLRIDQISPGQYAIAKGAVTLSDDSPAGMKPFASATPNPVNDKVRLSAGAPFDKILIFNGQGKNLREISIQSATFLEIPVTDFPPGPYWFTLFTEQGVTTLPVVIAR